jgi:hypothetical protein
MYDGVNSCSSGDRKNQILNLVENSVCVFILNFDILHIFYETIR